MCTAVEPILAALDVYILKNATHPKKLGDLPDFNELKVNAGVRIQAVHVRNDHTGFDIESLGNADITIYFGSGSYHCIVPIEHSHPLSFTRFTVYSRGAEDDLWHEDSILWHLGAR